jgi:hypothetical protein
LKPTTLLQKQEGLDQQDGKLWGGQVSN